MEKVIVVGTISNAEKSLEKDLAKLINALENTELLHIFLVESDSQDNTLGVLNKLSIGNPSFEFESLGQLKTKIPDKIDRLRFCRQKYVDHIREFNIKAKADFVVIADLDGMNTALRAEAVDECFETAGWDVVLANQTGGYYDLLALRHPTWCASDIKSELSRLQSKIDSSAISKFRILSRMKRKLELDKAARTAVYSKMKRIPKSASWIEVESGFGGFAIYKAHLFEIYDYSEENIDRIRECEHVALNLKIHKSGGRIYINPALVNTHFNSHNVRRFFLVRQLQLVYWSIVSGILQVRTEFFRATKKKS